MHKGLVFQRTIGYGLLGISSGAFLHSLCSLVQLGIFIVPALILMGFIFSNYLEDEFCNLIRLISWLALAGVIIASPVIDLAEFIQTKMELSQGKNEKTRSNPVSK